MKNSCTCIIRIHMPHPYATITAMPKRRDDHKALQAAFLRGRHKKSEREIGSLLGDITQSQVSRLLRRASEMHWLSTKVEYTFHEENVPGNALEELNRFFEPQRLKTVLNRVNSKTGVRV